MPLLFVLFIIFSITFEVSEQVYYTIGIDSPEITVSDDTATITYTSVLNANAYGAKGTFRMTGTHYYEKRNGTWIAVNRK